MSRTVDERVVEMQFDNGQFEKNVKTSMNTIDNLKRQLNFDGATKGLENVERASRNISFDQMASNIQLLANRFSTLGIVGMRVIEKLTDAMMNLATKTIGFVTNGIIQGGIRRATNLENAHFQLQGLLKDEKEVAGVMQNVSDAVDGTAYSLDAAAMVASQLAASGMRAGDDMYKSLKAVAGVAAMTNSSYEDIGHIFTTVAGNGRLMTEQLNQFSYKGLNVAATLAEQFGVTESEIREMVHDGKIDFQMFADAMDSAFGEHAKKANETFNGALSNIKAALGRIGALFVSPLIEQNGPLVQFLNTVRERINEVKTNIVPLAEIVTGTANKILTSVNKIIKDFKMDSNSFTHFTHTIRAFGLTAKNVFDALLTVLKPVQVAFKRMFPQSLSLSILHFANHVKFLSENLKLNTEEGKHLRETFRGIFSVIKLGIDILKALVKGVETIFSKFTGLRGNILEMTASIGNWLFETTNSIRESGLETTIGSFAEKIGEAASSVGDFISSLNILEGIGNVISKIFEKLGNALSGTGSFIKSVLSDIGGGLSSIFQNGDASLAINTTLLAALAYNIKKVFVQVRNLLAELGIIGTPKNPFAKIATTLNQAKDTLYQWEQQLNATYFLKIGGSLLMLAGALMIISSIDGTKLANSMAAITLLMGEMVGSMAALSQLSFDKSVRQGGKVLIQFSEALLILAVSVKILSSMSLEELGKGIGSVTILLGVMIGTVVALSKIQGNMSKCAGQLIGFAIAITILSGACRMLSGLSLNELLTGLVGIGLLLLELVGFMNVTQNLSVKSAGGLLAMSVALTILAGVVAIFGHMSMETLGKGFIALASGLLIMAVAMAAAENGLKGAAALVVMSAALAIFVPAILLLSMISWEGIAKSIVALAAGFGVLGLAGLLLDPLIPTLMVLSTVIGIFGLGVLAAGVGVAAFGVGLTALCAALAVSGPLLYSFIEQVLNLIPLLIQKIGEGIVLLCGEISKGYDALCACIVTLITSLLSAIKTCVPQAIDTGLTLLLAFLQGVRDNIGEIIYTGLMIVANFINGIAEALPDMIAAGFNLMISFIEGIAQAMEENADRMADAMWDLVDAFIDSAIACIVEGGSRIYERIKKAIFGDGVEKGIDDSKKDVDTSMEATIKDQPAMIDSYKDDFKTSGKNVTDGLINGVNENSPFVTNAFSQLGEDSLAAFNNSLEIRSPSRKFKKSGRYCDEGLIIGLKSLANKVADTSSGVGTMAMESMQESFSKATDIIQNGIDASPVIRPVVDLSNATMSARALNSMFGDGTSYGIAAKISSNNQKVTGGDIVSAIKQLGSNKSVGNTYNINGLSYNDGTDVANAIQTIIRAARIERRA